MIYLFLEEFKEMAAEDRYKLAEKSFSFWKDEANDNLFNENISIEDTCFCGRGK